MSEAVLPAVLAGGAAAELAGLISSQLSKQRKVTPRSLQQEPSYLIGGALDARQLSGLKVHLQAAWLKFHLALL